MRGQIGRYSSHKRAPKTRPITTHSREEFMRFVACSLAALLFAIPAAHAQMSDGKVKIGVLTDLSGPYEQNSGVGSVEAAKMAAEEFGNKVNGAPIEIVAADHQNKPDIGAGIARRWFDLDGVDAVTDLVNSAVAFAVLEIAKTDNKAVLLTSAGSADFTGKACAPNTSVHWVYDTYEMGAAIGQALPRLGKTWFFITADYVFGRALQAGATNFIEKNGGKVVGSVSHPLGTNDFSSFMLQAQASKADVVALANGGDDAINAIKSAREFGITEKQKVVPFGLDSLPAIRATSLQLAQGMTYVSPWLPDRDDAAKAFFAKFLERRKTAPSTFQVGTYSVVRSYLKAVEAANSDDPKIVIPKMREMPVNDAFTPNGHLRPDGRMVHDVYLVQIKSPAESKGNWDLLKLVATIPGDKAFRPLEDGACSALAH
jgi:branched-chain amino acid transport system substrate-binding protein